MVYFSNARRYLIRVVKVMALFSLVRNSVRIRTNKCFAIQLITNTCIKRQSTPQFARQLSTNATKLYKLNINKSITRNIIINQQKCLFRTSPQRYNPIVAIILRQTAKFIVLISGRAVRKWWQNLPQDKRRIVLLWLSRHKWKFATIFGSLIGLFWLYYLSHIESTPITNRKRFIAFTQKQLQTINKIEFETQLELLKNKLLPSNHPLSKRVARVATQLLNGNSDLKQIHEHEWTVSVVDDSTIKNAFVLPLGQIFVFTGMLALCDNDQQLGTILSHEMAHSVLAHSAELLSHAHIVDLAFICLIGAIWLLLPTDIMAAFTTAVSRFVMDLLLDRPYNRMLETEADIVGLELAAKACFDVREISAFWHKMAINDSFAGIKIVSDDIDLGANAEFLSTHPSHESRYIYLDSIMDKAIELRAKCNCPALPRHDPRLNIEEIKKIIASEREKKTDGVIILKKPPLPAAFSA